MVPVFWQLNDYNGTDPDKKIAHTEANYTTSTIAEMNQFSMVGAMYFVTFMQMLLNFLPTVIIFQGEKPIFIRERAGNMYDIWVYATTKMFAEIPIMLFNPMLLLVLIYFAIGFCNYFTEFAEFYLILALMTQAAAAMGYFLSSAFNSETAAVAFVPIINMPLSLLGGYMINLKSIKGKYPQAIIEWVQYVSPVRYCFNGLMQSQWNNYCANPPQGLEANVYACGKAVNGHTVKKSILGFYGTTLTYFGCCSGLLFLWLFNRAWVVISLTLQDANCACGADQNDTRNTKPSKAVAAAAAEAEIAGEE
jgi:ABC-type multidrug transport system permease subunit